MNRIIIYAAAFWLVLMFIAIGNGIARGLYEPALGEGLAHQVSTITGITLFLVATYLFLSKVDSPYGGSDLVIIGLMWLTLTLVFEFTFGHYVAGKTIDELLADYDLLNGRLWPLFLAAVAMGPYAIGEWVLGR